MLRLSGNRKGIKEVNRRLKAVENKFKLLFEPDTAKAEVPKLTEEELHNLLVNGNGIYWDIVGKTIVPCSTQDVVSSLKPKGTEEIDDVFYDFNRLREVS